MIDIKYYNYELDDPTTTEMGTDDVYAVVEVSGKVQWESRGQDIRYRNEFNAWDSPFNKLGQPNGAFEDFYVYGINIDVTSSGIVAKFDIMLFINTVIAAPSCSNRKIHLRHRGYQFTGVKSQLFSKFMREEVDLERECARGSRCRHSSQRTSSSRRTPTAAEISISEEIVQMLHGRIQQGGRRRATEGLSSEDPKYKKLMKSVLDDDEILALALYLMRCVDPDRAKHKLEGTELGIEDIAG